MTFYFASFVAVRADETKEREREIRDLGIRGRLFSFYHIEENTGQSKLSFDEHLRWRKRRK